jgi:aerobic-type carbon monoxide dehydrogenase small subunit (CoxS/CutS family)
VPSITLQVNGRHHRIDADTEMPLLWALRDSLGLVGTKFGCGGGFCGACTVHVDGDATRSCTLPLAKAAGRAVVTIEGLGAGADGCSLVRTDATCIRFSAYGWSWMSRSAATARPGRS